MYGNANIEDEDEFSLLRSVRNYCLTDYHIVAPYDVTILMIGCISMMAGLCLTIFTLVMARREEQEEDMNLYNSIMWGPALICLGCLMFVMAAMLCGREVQKNKGRQKVGLMRMEEKEKMKETVGFINDKQRSGGLAVIY